MSETAVPTGLTERCGFLIERSRNYFADKPGAYRVSKDCQSNIIGEQFFDEINAADDRTFEEFMATALRPDFPHPFATSEESGQ